MEVGGAVSIEKCLELVDIYESTVMHIIFLGNCCYGKNELLVRNIVRSRLFGDIVYCHEAYGNNLRREVACDKENRHYRLKHYLNKLFCFYCIFDAIRNKKPMPIDVYDAAARMCITALSEYSIANGNMPVEIPDFTRGK